MELILIKHEHTLKNDYNENLASKWSSGHAMQFRAMQKINCMSNTQPMRNTRSICIKDTRSNKGTSVRIQDLIKTQVWSIKIMQYNLKVLKTLQSKDT